MRTRKGIENTIFGILSKWIERKSIVKEITKEVLDYLIEEENLKTNKMNTLNKVLESFNLKDGQGVRVERINGITTVELYQISEQEELKVIYRAEAIKGKAFYYYDYYQFKGAWWYCSEDMNQKEFEENFEKMEILGIEDFVHLMKGE